MFVGRVYKIWAPGCEKVYVGSTIWSLIKRFAKHKKDFKRWQHQKMHYISSFEIIQHSDAEIELLHEDEFESIQELRELEKLWVSKMDTVNRCRPIRTEEELREYQKTYYSESVPCPTCGKKLRRDHVLRHTKAKHPINGTD